jgi:hypothetical protein
MHEYLPFWAVAMLLTGGLFAGAVFAVSWGFTPLWQKLPANQFKSQLADFTKTSNVVQPLMALAAIISSIGYAASCHGMGVTLSTLAACGYILAILFSAAIVMPLQRKILVAKVSQSDISSMRAIWINYHYLRTVLVIVSFALSCGAVAVHL